MVHGNMAQRIIPMTLKSAWKTSGLDLSELKIVAVPTPADIENEDACIEIFNQHLAGIDPHSVSAIILESNYGFPSKGVFVEKIFEYVNTMFMSARIIAYSSTIESLELAFKANKNICLCYNGRTLDEAFEELSTYFSLTDMEKEDLNNRLFSKNIAKELVDAITNAITDISMDDLTLEQDDDYRAAFTPSYVAIKPNNPNATEQTSGLSLTGVSRLSN